MEYPFLIPKKWNFFFLWNLFYIKRLVKKDFRESIKSTVRSPQKNLIRPEMLINNFEKLNDNFIDFNLTRIKKYFDDNAWKTVQYLQYWQFKSPFRKSFPFRSYYGSVTKSPKRLKLFFNVTGNVLYIGTNHKNFNLTMNNCSQDVSFIYWIFCLKRVFPVKSHVKYFLFLKLCKKIFKENEM